MQWYRTGITLLAGAMLEPPNMGLDRHLTTSLYDVLYTYICFFLHGCPYKTPRWSSATAKQQREDQKMSYHLMQEPHDSVHESPNWCRGSFME